MRKIKLYIVIFCITLPLFFFPYNEFYYLKNHEGIIKLTRVKRTSLLMDYDLFFVPGCYKGFFQKPDVYVQPVISLGPFDICFDFYWANSGDTVIVYPGYLPFVGNNMDEKIKIIDLPAYGKLTFHDLEIDSTGRYMYVDCTLGNK